MDDTELENFLSHIKESVKKKVANWPDHYDFLQHYCKTSIKP
jgi:tryptophan halogenase